MIALQEMKLQQINEKKSDFQKIKFHIYLQKTIDDLLDLYDHAALILRYFTESENPNIQLHEATCETMRIIGWRYGIMFSWNFIVTKAELSQN